MLCSVVKHAGSGRARKKCRGKHEKKGRNKQHELLISLSNGGHCEVQRLFPGGPFPRPVIAIVIVYIPFCICDPFVAADSQQQA